MYNMSKSNEFQDKRWTIFWHLSNLDFNNWNFLIIKNQSNKRNYNESFYKNKDSIESSNIKIKTNQILWQRIQF